MVSKENITIEGDGKHKHLNEQCLNHFKRNWKIILIGVLIVSLITMTVFLILSKNNLKRMHLLPSEKESISVTHIVENINKSEKLKYDYVYLNLINEMVNRTADPCEDFYSFACAKYSELHPIDEYSIDIFANLKENIKKRKHKFLEEEVLESNTLFKSVENKLKMLYQSCRDVYADTNVNIQALINIINDIGGADLLETWNESTFDLNAILGKLHVLYNVPALFHYRILEGVHSGGKILQLYIFSHIPIPSEDRMPSEGTLTQWSELDYVDHDYDVYSNEDIPSFFSEEESITEEENLIPFKNFVSKLLSQLLEDAQVKINQSAVIKSKISIFIEDLIFMHQHLKNISGWKSNYYEIAKPMKLVDLSRQASAIDWFGYLKYVFPNVTFSNSTSVFCHKWHHFFALNNLLENVHKRVLQNYFIWVIITEYSYDLSAKYATLHDEYFSEMGIKNEYTSRERHCFELAEKYMPDVFQEVYVDFNISEVTNEVEQMMNSLNKYFVNLSQEFYWMDLKDQKTFRQKMQDLKLFGLSHTNSIKEDFEALYSQIDIKKNDFFHNRLELNKIDRIRMMSHRSEMVQNNGKDDIKSSIFSIYLLPVGSVGVHLPKDLLIYPLFNTKFPQFMKFGRFGYLYIQHIMRFFIHMGIGDTATYPDKELQWNAFTFSNYKKLINCFSSNSEDWRDEDVTEAVIQKILASIYSLKVNYKALKIWQMNNYFQTVPDDFSVITEDQAFFLAYAQSACESWNQEKQIRNKHGLSLNDRMLYVLSQVKEFSNAFHCSEESSINTRQTCINWKEN